MAQLESRSPVVPGSVSAEGGDTAAALSLQLRPLAAERLSRPADLSALAFNSTADLEPEEGLVGQVRALDAIEFGTRIAKPGFNLFVIGPNGMRAQDAVELVLQKSANSARW